MCLQRPAGVQASCPAKGRRRDANKLLSQRHPSALYISRHLDCTDIPVGEFGAYASLKSVPTRL